MTNPESSKEITTASGLKYTMTQVVDQGPKPKRGDIVAVHYRGYFANGKEFDNSFLRNQPIEFQLGVGMVIEGWDEGIALLSPGEKATFVIPPHLGYGNDAIGGIPANATLYFDVELISIN